MYYQEREGIYVYFVKRSGWCDRDPEFFVEFYEDFNRLFSRHSEWEIRYLFKDFEAIQRNISKEDGRHIERYPESAKYYRAAYDWLGNWYQPDVLLGKYRKWRSERIGYLKKREYWQVKQDRKRRGRKPKAIGSLVWAPIGRKLRQAFHDPEALELGISFDIGKEKSARMLQLPYEDCYYHRTEKSWKTQSKRKRQWK